MIAGRAMVSARLQHSRWPYRCRDRWRDRPDIFGVRPTQSRYVSYLQGPKSDP
jgi:hypothetical protein